MVINPAVFLTLVIDLSLHFQNRWRRFAPRFATTAGPGRPAPDAVAASGAVTAGRRLTISRPLKGPALARPYPEQTAGHNISTTMGLPFPCKII